MEIFSNIPILQTKLDELKACIETVEVNDDKENSYEEAIETLLGGVNKDIEEIEWLKNDPSTLAEEVALLEIGRKIKELDKMRWQKLDEIGYESPEDSRACLFPNGEDED